MYLLIGLAVIILFGVACSPPLPVGEVALSWEAEQLQTPFSYNDLCLAFVRQAYQVEGQFREWMRGENAGISLQNAMKMSGWNDWNKSSDPPRGAVVYWSPNDWNGHEGHVVICTGDGMASSSGWKGTNPFPGSTNISIEWLNSQEGGPPAGWILP